MFACSVKCTWTFPSCYGESLTLDGARQFECLGEVLTSALSFASVPQTAAKITTCCALMLRALDRLRVWRKKTACREVTCCRIIDVVAPYLHLKWAHSKLGGPCCRDRQILWMVNRQSNDKNEIESWLTVCTLHHCSWSRQCTTSFTVSSSLHASKLKKGEWNVLKLFQQLCCHCLFHRLCWNRPISLVFCYCFVYVCRWLSIVARKTARAQLQIACQCLLFFLFPLSGLHARLRMVKTVGRIKYPLILSPS